MGMFPMLFQYWKCLKCQPPTCWTWQKTLLKRFISFASFELLNWSWQSQLNWIFYPQRHNFEDDKWWRGNVGGHFYENKFYIFSCGSNSTNTSVCVSVCLSQIFPKVIFCMGSKVFRIEEFHPKKVRDPPPLPPALCYIWGGILLF